MSETHNFYEGEAWCLVTLLPVAGCEHCKALALEPRGRPLEVVGVDHDTGTVTLEEVPDAAG